MAKIPAAPKDWNDLGAVHAWIFTVSAIATQRDGWSREATEALYAGLNRAKKESEIEVVGWKGDDVDAYLTAVRSIFAGAEKAGLKDANKLVDLVDHGARAGKRSFDDLKWETSPWGQITWFVTESADDVRAIGETAGDLVTGRSPLTWILGIVAAAYVIDRFT